MKTRLGFVSNSSSSSFVIRADDLTGTQIRQILQHIEESKRLDAEYAHESWCNDEGDAWDIEFVDQCIRGHTWMDNFSMSHFLEQIGVDDALIRWNE
jgi:hypothetical protein